MSAPMMHFRKKCSSLIYDLKESWLTSNKIEHFFITHLNNNSPPLLCLLKLLMYILSYSEKTDTDSKE